MTVASQVNKVQAVGNDAARTFSFSPMILFDIDDLVVIVTVIATGVETVITRGTGATNYLVNNTTFPSTGSIDYPASGGTLLTSTQRISIIRALTLEQLTDLENQGGYLPEVQEDQFDKLVMMIQQHQEALNRSLQIQRSELTTVDAELPSLIGNESLFVRVNADGDGFDLVALTGVSGALSSAAGAQVVLTNPSSGSSNDIARADHTHQSPSLVLAATFAYAGENFT